MLHTFNSSALRYIFIVISSLIVTKRNRVIYAIARKLYSRKIVISACRDSN